MTLYVSVKRKRVSNVNMSVPKSKFEGKFSIFLAGVCFLYFRGLKCDCCTSRHLLCERILNYFGCVEIRILVEKLNKYKAHIFPT
jgi:hypothetical protein